MSRAFNFYQYEGSGQGQFIAPFATLFTGFYFPQDLSQGGAVGFLWHLVDDDRLRPVRFAVRASGQWRDGNNHPTDITIDFSGNAFPTLTDSGDYSMSFTGQQTGAGFDVYTLDTAFSGFNSGTSTDTPDFSGSFTGAAAIVLNDTYIYDFLVTGKQVSGNIEPCTCDFDFSGNFVGKDKDTAAIDFVFAQVIYNAGAATITISTGDNANVDLVFGSVTYRPN